jgi:hypothetical protein
MICIRTSPVAGSSGTEVWGDLVALLVFKTSVGLNKVPGGFDSHPPPPIFQTRALKMLKRIPQPPVNPALRARERHDFWPGFVVVIVGAVVAYCGARHLTGVDTVEQNAATEIQLVKAFSSGGVQYASEQAPPPPPNLEGMANPAEALDRWAKQQANAQPLSWKIRVDVGAKTPCPT